MEIIIKPVLTEKMTALTDKQRKVAFIVAKEANKIEIKKAVEAMYGVNVLACLLYTSPSPRDAHESRMPSSA